MRDSKTEVLSDDSINSDTGLSILEDECQLDRVNEQLRQSNMVLVIKRHPFENVTRTW